MINAFKNLEKILLQERKLGYKNKAVIGGLELFAKNWFPQALKEASSKDERLRIEKISTGMKSYGGKKELDARKDALQTMLDLLQAKVDIASPQSTNNTGEIAEELRADVVNADTAPDNKVPNTQETEHEPEAKTQQQVEPPPRANKHSKEKSRPSKKTKKNKAALTPIRDTSGLEGLESSVTKLPGIKDGYASKLERLGVVEIGDLLTLYPHRYDDYRSLKTINQLEYNEDVTIIAQVWRTNTRRSKANRPIVTCTLSDGTGTIEATWFNQPWLENQLKSGTQIVLSSRVGQYLGKLTFQGPDWEKLDKTLVHTGRLVPVYPLTSGITANWIRNLQKRTVDYWSQRLPDHLPDEVLARQNFFPIHEAVSQIHFPDSWEDLEAARRRLAFDELLLIQLGVLKQKQQWQKQACPPLSIEQSFIDRFIAELPFPLTGAQKRVLDEILIDMEAPRPMSRLLQGDVGSGKTVVALAAMLGAVSAGGQAAILAPTEILAEQHFAGMQAMLDTANLAEQINIQLLTGSTKANDRADILANLDNGSIHLLVGTHAIIQDDVNLQNLKLAVVDEQHRFGVNQRGTLREKGPNAHMLVMSATPIPRSLALTLYGDLDLSIIDEMPPGRQTIATRWLMPKERERAYAFLRAQITQGFQAFVICPLVEESDKIEAKSAIEEHARLQEKVFPDLSLGLLHGRMKSQEKESVMADFRDKKTQILVSTSVVEVGIDIPNASTILIEGANRFGLAQLHQFRGRVGRGPQKSYCLLLADNAGTDAQARLQVMERTNNGFELAEEDMKLRGPGEFFGTRQSGLPSLKLVKLTDTKLLELARSEAQVIFDQDPVLEKPEHQLLVKRVQSFWAKMTDPN
ncbi:MAG: ATP-dependent DNA helicase RecG [Chloroflexota bacterium]